jgi:hypothetical protein
MSEAPASDDLSSSFLHSVGSPRSNRPPGIPRETKSGQIKRYGIDEAAREDPARVRRNQPPAWRDREHEAEAHQGRQEDRPHEPAKESHWGL